MQRKCDQCGVPYTAKRQTSRFCSAICRKRASRKINPDDVPRVIPVGDRAIPAGELEVATRTELERAERVNTPNGQAALALARRVDDRFSGDTGSSFAAVVREHAARMLAAMDGVAAAQPTALTQLLDEVKARRDARAVG